MVEKRTLWKRAADFWDKYKRSKFGLLGLAILMSFVFMAVFAPFLTPYDPILDRDLAGWLAYPEWIGLIDPSKAGLPPNIRIPMVKQAIQGEGEMIVSNSSLIKTFVEDGSLIVEVVNPTGTLRGKESITLISTFEYQYDPPRTFGISLWGNLTGDTEDFILKAKFDLTKPNGEKVKVWESGYTAGFLGRIKSGQLIDVRSSSPVLLLMLGLPPQREYFAKKVFSEKGLFQLKATFEFTMSGTGKPSKLRLILHHYQFIVYGRRFGLLGTDDMARDIFTQIVYGARISLMVGIAASLTTVGLSVLVGVIAGYMGGKTDEALMRFADLVMVLPGLPLMIVIASVLGGGLMMIVLLLSVLGWAGSSRNIRAFVLSIKEMSYVEASRAKGAGSWRIIFKHILPSVMPIAYANLALYAPLAITTEAELSYLGVGGNPFLISWGKMLQYAQTRGAFQYNAWWWVIPPGLCIALLSLSFILIGHSLDEILNPRLRRR